MKKAILAASVTLFAAAAQANDTYKVEAHLALNDKEVAVYSDEVPAGATGYFSKTVKVPNAQGKSKNGESDDAPETGFTFTATPSTNPDGSTYVRYTMSYTTQKESNQDRDGGMPGYRNFATVGTVKVTDGVPQSTSSGTASESWVLTVNAKKI